MKALLLGLNNAKKPWQEKASEGFPYLMTDNA
jgi:hypothetical protein